MGMPAFYCPPKPEDNMISVIHQAINPGITFLDTSDVYVLFTNEILLGKALRDGFRDMVDLATKFGLRVLENSSWEISGKLSYVREACEGSLKRLGVQNIDLYYQYRIDTGIPIEVTVGELKKIVKEGKIKYI